MDNGGHQGQMHEHMESNMYQLDQLQGQLNCCNDQTVYDYNDFVAGMSIEQVHALTPSCQHSTGGL